LALTDSLSDKQIREAFQSRGLDPGNPYDWKMLVSGLLDNEKTDPREKWDEITRGAMLCRFHELRATLRYREAVERLAKSYPRYSEETIERELKNAFKKHIAPVVERLLHRYAKIGDLRSRPQLRCEALSLFCEAFSADLRRFATEDELREIYTTAWPR
jgi:hypothetical protein